MKRVRFLEDCYLFDIGKFCSYNDVLDIDKARAEDLFEKKLVDILNEEVKKKTTTKKKDTKKKTTPKKTTKKEKKKEEKKDKDTDKKDE